MINQDTRRLSKMPEDVRTEISPTFVQRYATEEVHQRIAKLDNTAKYIQSDLSVSAPLPIEEQSNRKQGHCESTPPWSV
jgi:hypothetical protein